MNLAFSCDCYRYFGVKKIPIKQLFLLPPEIKYLRLLRATSSSKGIIRLIRKYLLMRMQHKTQIQIPAETKIGVGFYIGHTGRIIINPAAVLGNNINIATGVTIGQTNRGSKKGVPTIGSKVWIGTNAVVVGGITIGDDVLIAPNTYVNQDIPAHSVVVGNPMVITHRDNATHEYIENIVMRDKYET